MPVILATQEAEIKRIVIQSQPRQIVREILSQRHPSQKKGWRSSSSSKSACLASMKPWVQTPVLPKKNCYGLFCFLSSVCFIIVLNTPGFVLLNGRVMNTNRATFFQFLQLPASVPSFFSYLLPRLLKLLLIQSLTQALLYLWRPPRMSWNCSLL
jgi:hypothetical protein